MLQVSLAFRLQEMLWLSWRFLLIPDPTLVLGVTGAEAFLTIKAVEDRVFDCPFLGIATETSLGAAGVVVTKTPVNMYDMYK